MPISRRRREDINRLADDLRMELGLAFPVDPRKAVEALGGTVEFGEDCGHPDADGMIKLTNEGSFEIRVREQAANRERFTLAHELGHLVLHTGFFDAEPPIGESDYIDTVYMRAGHSDEESEANEFAGAFLMPARQFHVVARQHLRDGTYDLSPIAEHFGVSVDAARVRGRWLGLFAWS